VMQPSVPVVVSKTYDLTLWMLPKLAKFPRDQRFLLGDRIENMLLDILEDLIDATYTKEKVNILKKANLRLEKLRFLVRLSSDMRFINLTSYEFAGRGIDEVGRMVGGWISSRGGSASGGKAS